MSFCCYNKRGFTNIVRTFVSNKIVVQKFSYIKNYTREEGTILLYDNIGSFVDSDGNIKNGISGSAFAHEMSYLSDNCKKVNVRINSYGGSVIDGYSILSSILNSKSEVHTFIDGVAASTAGWVALAGKHRSIMDYGTVMLHNPYGGNDDEALNAIKSAIVKIISNRSGLSIEEVSGMMEKETWLSSEEAKQRGFCDSVISTKKKVHIDHSMSIQNLHKIYNQIITKKPMGKLNQLLNLGEAAEVAEQESAVEALKKSISNKDQEINDLKNKLKQIEDSEKEALKKDAETFVETLNLPDEKKAEVIANASRSRADLAFVKNVFDVAASGKSKKPFNPANHKDVESEDRSTWSYNDWEAKDVAGLKKMFVENKAKFDELVKTIKTK
jgi:ATP-dependent protease ClpP protease subunit